MTNDIEKLPLTSKDVNEERLQALRQLFPESFKEGMIDWPTLQRSLGEWVDPGKERFGLNWPGKADCMKVIQQPSVGTLLPVRDESVNFDTSENLIIEGDNLEVLKLLQKSYYGKVKMIYIDPPYNTGNEFIYPDNFQEGLQEYLRYSGQVNAEGLKLSANTESEGRYHSKWLSMMYSRMFLARNLLTDAGLIFVSIDDNEVQNLRLLMNEVFGEENFVACIIWKKSYGGGAKVKHVVGLHEYVLVYCRSKESLPPLDLPPNPDTLKYYKFKDDKFEKRGPYRTQPLATTSMDDRPNLRFAIPWQGIEIWPEKQWQWSQARVMEALANDDLVIQNRKDKWVVDYKQYLKDEDGNVRGAKPFTVLDGPYTQRGTDEIKALFGDGKIFEFPKPSALVKHFLQYAEPDALVLDFFAGSASTADAVLKLNEEDAGERRFILVQLPEKTDNPKYPTIAHITRDRVRKVIASISESNSQNLALSSSKNDLGFRAFALSTSSFSVWNGDADKIADLGQSLQLFAEHVNEDRQAEDILYELLLKSGFPLTAPIEKLALAGKEVFSVSDGAFLICLDRSLSLEVIEAMVNMEPARIICLDEGFKGNDQLKVNAVQTVKSRNQNDETDIVFRVV